jgi:GNAT superfamily N-acetyltransferase
VVTDLSFGFATEDDTEACAALRKATVDTLIREYGTGAWAVAGSVDGVRRSLRNSRILLIRVEDEVVGMLRLMTKKPWAIDVDYFTPVRRPLYLLDMAVAPDRQRQGIGRRMLERALEVARNWPADAVRLDAYDAPAGAGPFYEKCGWVERGRVVYRKCPLIYYERVLNVES